MRASQVYYQEFDLSQIATADGQLPAAIVTAATQGDPFRRVLSTTTAEWIGRFGKPNTKVSFGGYCALAYLNSGRQLWTVRATGVGAQYGSAMLQKRLIDTQVVFNSILPTTSQLVQGDTPLASDTFDFTLNLVPATPGTVTATPSASGGTLTAATYSYAVTSVNANGESAATALSPATTTGSTGSIALSWTAVPGAVSYNVYGRTPASGNVPFLINVSSPAYTDTNVAVPSSTILAQPALPSNASAIGDNLVLFSPLGPGGYSSGLSVEIISANLLPVVTSSLTATPFGSGGGLAAATYKYTVTATNAFGETLAVTAVSATISSGTTGSVVLGWAKVPGATGYNVYGRTATSGNLPLLASVNTNGYIDTGAAIQSATRPAQPLATQVAAISSVTATPSASGGTLAAATYTYSVTAVTSIGETVGSAMVTATTNGSTGSIALSWAAVTGATSYKVYGRTGNPYVPFLATVTGATTYTDTGSATPSVSVLSQPLTYAYITPVSDFKVNVYSSDVSLSTPAESYQVTLGDQLDGFNQQMRIQDVINNVSHYIKVVNNSSVLGSLPIVNSTPVFALPTGNSGAAVTDSDIINGWNMFLDTEQVYVRLLINGGYSSVAVQKAMDNVATVRQDSIAFLDMPSNQQKAADAVNYRNFVLNLNSNRSAIFAQDLYINDTFNGRAIYVPPSGHMAALAARSAFLTAPWYPMAGLNRGQLDVLGVRVKYSDGDRQLLKSAQVNYVRVTPGQGTSLTEQVTLQSKVSALSFISIRQLVDEIQLASRAFLNFSLQELNDDFLRRQIVGGLTDFLQDIQNRRGLKSFLVVCDSRNNNAQTEGEGQLIVTVFLEPTLPVDSITLQGVITKQGADFTALIGKF